MYFVAIKWVAAAIAAVVVSGTAYYVTSTLLSVGGLRENVKELSTVNAQWAAANEDIRDELARLAATINKKERNERQIALAFNELRNRTRETTYACDPEPLDDSFVDGLREAAGIARSGGTAPPDDPSGMAPADAAPGRRDPTDLR